MPNLDWVMDEIALLAVAFDVEITSERLRIYAEDLADIAREQLSAAFRRARHELKFFPRIAELRELALGSAADNRDAEALRAWETATDFADTWVCSDVYGRYVVDGGCRTEQPPQISERILHAVRACRGWRAFKCRTPENEAFLRKDFLAAYQLAPTMDTVPLDRLLTVAPERNLLEMPKPPRSAPAIQTPATVEPPKFVIKRIPEPLTEAQIRDRREMLQQQKAQVLKRSAK
jgi:hypothetical protein